MKISANHFGKQIVRMLLGGLPLLMTPLATLAESSDTPLAAQLMQFQTAYQKHPTNRSLFAELFAKPPATQKDRDWVQKNYKEILDQAPPKLTVDQISMTFKGANGVPDLKVEVIDAVKGQYKIGGYDAQIDVGSKELKSQVQYVERILRKIDSSKKSAAHSAVELLVPNAEALSWPLFLGIGVVGGAYYIYQWSNSALSNVSDVFNVNSVTEAEASCTGPNNAEETCNDAIGTKPYEVTLVRNGKVERYHLCHRGGTDKAMSGSFVRIADSNDDGVGERVHFTDANTMTAEPAHNLPADEVARIRAVTSAVASCCQAKKKDCSDYIKKRLPLRDASRQQATGISRTAQ